MENFKIWQKLNEVVVKVANIFIAVSMKIDSFLWYENVCTWTVNIVNIVNILALIVNIYAVIVQHSFNMYCLWFYFIKYLANKISITITVTLKKSD